MPRPRSILAVSLLALLLLSCVGREPAPQPAAAPQDTATLEQQPQTLEEKYPGYSIEVLTPEYSDERDATAPVIYSVSDTSINDDKKAIWIRNYIVRESLSSLDSLPDNIKEYFGNNSITIPAFDISFPLFRCQSFYKSGNFDGKSKNDLAVICYKDSFCWLAIFWNTATSDTSIVNYISIEESFYPGMPARSLILTDDTSYISLLFNDAGYFSNLSSGFNYFLWPQSPTRPDSFTHDGLAECDPFSNDYFYYYFDDGHLLTWGDAMPGWQEWHELNKVTMQDSLLLDPLLAKELPPQLAQEWHNNGIKLARLGENPWCITGEFIRKGQTDCMVWLFDQSSVTIELVLLSDETPRKYHTIYSFSNIEYFKQTSYKLVGPEQVADMYRKKLDIIATDYKSNNTVDTLKVKLSPPFECDGLYFENCDPQDRNNKEKSVLVFQKSLAWEIFISYFREKYIL